MISADTTLQAEAIPASRTTGTLDEIRSLLKLATPLALAFGGNQMLSVVDTAMVGRLGATELAGVAIGSALFFAITVAGLGAVLGMDPLVSQAIGAGEGRRARAVVRAGMRLGTLLGVGLMAVAAASPFLLPTVGVDAATSAEAHRYVLGRLPGMIPFLWIMAMRSYMQSLDVSRPIVTSMLAANLVNVIANAVLIFGDGALTRIGLPAIGLPALHVLGSSLASSLATIAQLAVMGLALRAMAVPPGDGDEAVGALDVLRVGWPIALTLLAEVGAFSAAGVLAGRIGPAAASGHQVAITIASLSFCVTMGISSATGARVGRAVGRRDSPGARRAGFAGLLASFVYMALCAITLALFADPIARLLSDRPEVLAAAVPLVQIAAFFQLSDGIQVTAAGALRAIGDTRFIQWANLFGHYVVGLPLAVGLAFWAGQAERGLWWGLSAGLTAVAVPLVWRFHRKSRGPIARLA
jgi:MATE family multidrug resistance protein